MMHPVFCHINSGLHIARLSTNWFCLRDVFAVYARTTCLCVATLHNTALQSATLHHASSLYYTCVCAHNMPHHNNTPSCKVVT